jgi:hypothetical protein
MIAKCFELLIDHIMESTKSSLFDAARKSSNEESFESFPTIDILGSRVYGCISVEIC